MSTGSELGQRIREVRKELKISQKELAYAARISQGYLSQVETGQVKNVSSRIVLKLAEALATDIYSLMDERPIEINILPELAVTISKMSHVKQRSLLELLKGLK